jgi:AcrR family transcriptional regulator
VARTPSKEAHDKILQAVLKLIAEKGVEATSMDAIAAEAGVSKATVYKHWGTKDALLIDAVQQHSAEVPPLDGPSVRETLIQLLQFLSRRTGSETIVRVWPRIMSYASNNREFFEAMRERLFKPRQEGMTKLLARAVEEGELEPGLDPEFAADMLIGPVMHRRFSDAGRVPEDLPARVVDVFFRAFRPASPSTRESAPRPSSGSRKSSRS